MLPPKIVTSDRLSLRAKPPGARMPVIADRGRRGVGHPVLPPGSAPERGGWTSAPSGAGCGALVPVAGVTCLAVRTYSLTKHGEFTGRCWNWLLLLLPPAPPPRACSWPAMCACARRPIEPIHGHSGHSRDWACGAVDAAPLRAWHRHAPVSSPTRIAETPSIHSDPRPRPLADRASTPPDLAQWATRSRMPGRRTPNSRSTRRMLSRIDPAPARGPHFGSGPPGVYMGVNDRPDERSVLCGACSATHYEDRRVVFLRGMGGGVGRGGGGWEVVWVVRGGEGPEVMGRMGVEWWVGRGGWGRGG
jgi:hypothetical protein